MTATTTSTISAEERERRAAAIRFAWASVGLEGLTPSPAADERALRFINGEIDLAGFMEPIDDSAPAAPM